jgi:hypothetical protein
MIHEYYRGGGKGGGGSHLKPPMDAHMYGNKQLMINSIHQLLSASVVSSPSPKLLKTKA